MGGEVTRVDDAMRVGGYLTILDGGNRVLPGKILNPLIGA
jgi:hypothetical protein